MVLSAKTSTRCYDPAANAQSSPISSSHPIFYCSDTAAEPACLVGLSTCHRGGRVLSGGSLPLICLPADTASEPDMKTRGRRGSLRVRYTFNRRFVPFTTFTWPYTFNGRFCTRQYALLVSQKSSVDSHFACWACWQLAHRRK